MSEVQYTGKPPVVDVSFGMMKVRYKQNQSKVNKLGRLANASDAERIASILNMHKNTREVMYAFYLDDDLKVRAFREIGSGTQSEVLIGHMVAFGPAVVFNLGKTVFIHNHPSGSQIPSPADYQTAANLEVAAAVLNMEEPQHYVCGRKIGEEPQIQSFDEAGIYHAYTNAHKSLTGWAHNMSMRMANPQVACPEGIEVSIEDSGPRSESLKTPEEIIAATKRFDKGYEVMGLLLDQKNRVKGIARYPSLPKFHPSLFLRPSVALQAISVVLYSDKLNFDSTWAHHLYWASKFAGVRLLDIIDGPEHLSYMDAGLLSDFKRSTP